MRHTMREIRPKKRAWLRVLVGLGGLIPVGASAEPPAESWDEDVDAYLEADDGGPLDEEPGKIVIVPNERVSTARLEALERELVNEMNVLRANPRAYAKKLEAMLPSYQGNLIVREGKPNILTQEGVEALKEAIVALGNAPVRLPRLAWSEGLAHAAADHAADLDRHDGLGHKGSDGSGPDKRVARHGEWQSLVAENISFGPHDAEEIVMGLLVDDGVPDRGHREVLLMRELFFAGAGCGPHPSYGTVCVIDYATAFRTHEAMSPESAHTLPIEGAPADAPDAPDEETHAGDVPEEALEPSSVRPQEDGLDEPSHATADPTLDALGPETSQEVPLAISNSDDSDARGNDTARLPPEPPRLDHEAEARCVGRERDEEPVSAPTDRVDGSPPGPVQPSDDQKGYRYEAPVRKGAFVIRYYQGPPAIGRRPSPPPPMRPVPRSRLIPE